MNIDYIFEDNFLINDVSTSDQNENFQLQQKQCAVCGDKAFGFNFGAITCESCKAFFRRNAVKKITSCVFNRDCVITVNTRRFCGFCRLKKCFQVNMKKEKILVKQRRRLMLVRPVEQCSPDTGSSPGPKPEVMACVKQAPYSPTPAYISLSPTTSNLSSMPWSSVQGPSSHSITSSPTTTTPNSSFQMESTVIKSVSKNSRLISLNDKLTREGLARLLQETEWLTLTGLYESYVTNFIRSGAMPTSNIEQANLASLVNSSGFIVRRYINFAKKIAEFASLEQPCQIVLLKGAVLCSIILRSVIEYDIGRSAWVTPEGEISSDVIKADGLNDLHTDYATYCKSFKRLMGSDNYMVCLSQILCLFSSENVGLTDRQIISDIHDKYLVLLKHYLEATYGFMESKPLLVSMLNNMHELQKMTIKHGQILLHVDPTNVDPLMLEVFNMSISNYFK